MPLQSQHKTQIIIAIITGLFGLIGAIIVISPTLFDGNSEPSPGNENAQPGQLPRTGDAGQPGALLMDISARPTRVTAGRHTVITVQVREGNGKPISGATVTISAGGGRFMRPGSGYDPNARLHEPYEIGGLTDTAGNFIAWWACNPCAGGYQMSTRAEKQDYEEIRDTFAVPIDRK